MQPLGALLGSEQPRGLDPGLASTAPSTCLAPSLHPEVPALQGWAGDRSSARKVCSHPAGGPRSARICTGGVFVSSGVAIYLPGASGHLTMSLSLTNFSCAPPSSLGSARVPVAGRSWTGSFMAAFGLRVLGTEPVGRGPSGPPRCRAQCGVLYLQRGTEAQQQPRDKVTTVTSVLTGDSTRHG